MDATLQIALLVGFHDPDGIEIRLYQPIGEQL
jgi:hypothetical protein